MNNSSSSVTPPPSSSSANPTLAERKETYKAQRKNYAKEKKRVERELLSTFKDQSIIVLADWLKVRGSLKSWTKLWCVLKPGLLLIYKSSKAKVSKSMSVVYVHCVHGRCRVLSLGNIPENRISASTSQANKSPSETRKELDSLVVVVVPKPNPVLDLQQGDRAVPTESFPPQISRIFRGKNLRFCITLSAFSRLSFPPPV